MKSKIAILLVTVSLLAALFLQSCLIPGYTVPDNNGEENNGQTPEDPIDPDGPNDPDPIDPGDDKSTLVGIANGMKSYLASLTLNISDGKDYDEEFNEKYYVDNGKVKIEYEYDDKTVTEYGKFIGDKHEYIFEKSGTYYAITNESRYYNASEPFSFIGVAGLREDAFTVSGNTYTAKTEFCNEMGKIISGDNDSPGYNEIFNKVEITVENGAVRSIVLSSVVEYSSTTITSDFVLTFSQIGETEVTIPEHTSVSDEEYKTLGLASKNTLLNLEEYGAIPSKGAPKLLVIPVSFPDSKFFVDDSGEYFNDTDAISIAFNGDADYPQNSVSSFYYTSSYGLLDMSFDIAPEYVCEHDSSYYSNIYDGGSDDSADEAILIEAIKALDGQIDFSKYDCDGDGFVDGVYLIYSHETDYENDTLWWSWMTMSSAELDADGKYIGGYVWAGIDTLYDYYNIEDEEDERNYEFNIMTLIHETGHMLGLDDFYDTDPEVGPSGGCGFVDIMESMFTDHCAFSKIKLGWIREVINGNNAGTYEIGDLATGGQCIVIKKDGVEGYNGEFIVIEMYAPVGLNGFVPDTYGLTTPCVRMYHVDATTEEGSDFSKFSPAYVYNNGTTEHKFIKLIEADGGNDIEGYTEEDGYLYSNTAEESDFFMTGSSFGANYKWYDGTDFGYTVNIQTVTDNSATVIVSAK